MRARGLLVISLLALACACASAQDFRKVTWGMSPQEVTDAEQDLHFAQMNGTTQSILTSPVTVLGHAGVLSYTFEDGKLVMAQYRLDDDDELRTYAEVFGALTDKYGATEDAAPAESRWNLERTFIRLSSRDGLCIVSYADFAWIARLKEKQRAESDPLF